MIFRTAVVGVGCALVLGACDCGKVAGGGGGDLDASVDDAGLFVPADAGPVDAGLSDAGASGADVFEAAIVDSVGNLILLRLDGGTETLVDHLDAGIGRVMSPRFSPDGTRIAFADGTRAFVLEANRTITLPHTMRTGSGSYSGSTTHVEWSSDGKRLAIDGVDYATDAVSVYVVPQTRDLPIFVSKGTRWAWEQGTDGLLSSFMDLNRRVFVTQRFSATGLDAGQVFDGVVLDVLRDGRVLLQRSEVRDGGGGVDDHVLVRDARGGEALVLALGSASLSDPGDNAVGSWNSDEFAMRGFVPGAPSHWQVLRGTLDGGAALAPSLLFDRTADSQEIPKCLRWVPGTPWLSFLVNAPTPALFLAYPDGVVSQVSSPPLLRGGPGCLDWRHRRE